MYSFFFLIALLVSSNAAFGAENSRHFDKYQISVTPFGYGGGGRFTSIAIDPHNPETVLIGSDVAGVFKSTDGGKSFQLKGRDLEGFAVADIQFHPFLSRKAYLLTDDGFYISLDNGETWDKASAEIRYNSRFFGSRLMVFSKYSLWVATNKKGVFQIALNTPRPTILPVAGLEQTKVYGLAIFQQHLFAATSKGIYRYKKGRWQKWNAGLDPAHVEINDIAAHPRGRLYIVEHTKGLHAWNSQKRMWERRNPDLLTLLQLRSDAKYKITTPKAFKALAVHPDNPGEMFLATHPEAWPHLVFKTMNGGRSWKKIDAFRLSPEAADFWPVPKTVSAPEEIAFVPQNPLNLYLADWANVWKSTDKGLRWSQLHKGLQNTVISDIKAHPRDARKLFLSVWDNGLMISKDGGKTWNRKMKGVVAGHAQELEISLQNPLKMYLLTNPWFKKDKVYIYKTVDGGKNWQDISFPVPERPLPKLGYVNGMATNLEIDPSSDDTVYIATNGYGIFKSVNGGKSWKASNTGLKTPYIQGPDGLLIHPRNPGILFAGTLAGGIYKSADAGNSWISIHKEHPFILGMALDPSNPSRMLAGCSQKKIIRSEDGGRSWQEIQLPGRTPPPHCRKRRCISSPLPPNGFCRYNGLRL